MMRARTFQGLVGSAMIIFTVFVVVALLVATWAIFQWQKVEKNTVYGRTFDRTQFSRLREGATLDEVYSLLGEPLFIDINPDRQRNGAYRQTRDNVLSLQHAKTLVANTNVEIYLVYTSMKKASKDFYLYRLDIWDSKVFRRVQREHMD